MEKENRNSKRIMAVMPEEEPVFVRAESKQYNAKLVNISSGGALISVMDCEFQSLEGSSCRIFFSDVEAMFGVKGQVSRKSGRYAAFRFVEITEDNALAIAGKIARMENLSAVLCPTMSPAVIDQRCC